MNPKIDMVKIQMNDSILSAIKRMDEIGRKLLIVMEGDHFYGLVSIGDIQRAIINNYSINSEIKSILRSKINTASEKDDINQIKKQIQERRTEFMPIISKTGELIDVIFWEDVFQTEYTYAKTSLKLPVVIMAGGKGTRLRPLTNVLPKPLIPLGKKTIIETIIDKFINSGCSDFYISINYKADMIQHYFNSIPYKSSYNLNFFKESEPLGTAGSLHMLKNKITTTFFVSNCDIVINQDYAEIFKYHFENKNEITLVAALKHYAIPYGTISTTNNGLLDSLEEKPELIFKINAGLYILEPHLLNEIPVGKFYHITNLIDKLYQEKRRIGVFPVSQKSWIDIGNWDEYINFCNREI